MTQAKMKLKKGDQVVVITGKDKGKTGEITKVLPAESRVVVAGVNMVTKHTKPTQFSAGGLNKVEAPIHVSNVALADPKTGKATKVGMKKLTDGKKVRVAKKSGETIA
ncbi:MAG TPA: 50S ribosomal protein L24 [Alphaproteobacteria bacterium]|nr:50S ribosomal protein L24 [Alphaproteobacteria bacterium]HNS43832.1 50S ribosomal protein L24 [Alphaproteobacteria bacterium]